MKLHVILIWMLGVILMPNLVAAGQVSWNTAGNGDWNTGSNWDTGVVPGAGDTVIIDLSGTYTVTLDVNPSIAQLTVGGGTGVQTLSLSSKTLQVVNKVTVGVSGALDLDGKHHSCG